MRRVIFVTLALLASLAAAYAETPDRIDMANRPEVETSALAPLGTEWRRVNPYRGDPAAIEVGKQAFAQTCARCHGPEANATGKPAPDLRRLDLACKRIADPAIKEKCVSDNDVFFSNSARKGKVIVGVLHMPAWEPVLGQELIWAIRSYIETRPVTRLEPNPTDTWAEH